MSALHIAAETNQLPLVQLLLHVPDVDPNRKNQLGFTPLHCAAAVGNTEVARALVESGRVDTQITNVLLGLTIAELFHFSHARN